MSGYPEGPGGRRSAKARLSQALKALPVFYALYIALVWWAYHKERLTGSLAVGLVLVVCLVAAPLQMLLNYRRWRREEEEAKEEEGRRGYM